MPTVAYGTWPSPIDATALVGGASSPTDVWAWNGFTWWSQARPAEQGRITLMRRDPDGTVTELLDEQFGARTRVNEYGGGAWTVVPAGSHAGAVVFCNWSDQRLYRLDRDGPAPVPLTAEPALRHGLRYADMRVTPDGTSVIAVRERHEDAAGLELPAAIHELVRVPLTDSAEAVQVLTDEADFVSSPRISPDGRELVWIAWDHPHMPWDSTRMLRGQLGDELTNIEMVAGGDDESLMQPDWTPAGRLLVVSDRRDGWWALHEAVDNQLHPLHQDDAEVGLPPWVFGGSHHAADLHNRLWIVIPDLAGAQLRRVDPDGTTAIFTTTALTLGALRADGDRLVALATYADRTPQVVEIDISGDMPGPVQVLLDGAPTPAGPVSQAQHLTFASAEGRQGHALLYLPAGAVAGDPLTAPPGDLPPALVHIHGGPTAAARPSYSLANQYWTSRGFAVLDVDYAGSTGYGRAYRRLLDGAWGIADVQDAIAAVTYAVDAGLVDGSRVAISGGSAGGFTVLRALATSSVFSAGASYYGVTDLAALVRDTHKFEARYLDGLIGPYPARADIYRERSPLSQIDQIRAPMIVLQGLLDRVVPVEQAQALVDALAANQVPHVYLTFPDEAHGFRAAQAVVTAQESELAFYRRVWGLTQDDDRPLEMRNS